MPKEIAGTDMCTKSVLPIRYNLRFFFFSCLVIKIVQFVAEVTQTIFVMAMVQHMPMLFIWWSLP